MFDITLFQECVWCTHFEFIHLVLFSSLVLVLFTSHLYSKFSILNSNSLFHYDIWSSCLHWSTFIKLFWGPVFSVNILIISSISKFSFSIYQHKYHSNKQPYENLNNILTYWINLPDVRWLLATTLIGQFVSSIFRCWSHYIFSQTFKSYFQSQLSKPQVILNIWWTDYMEFQ